MDGRLSDQTSKQRAPDDCWQQYVLLPSNGALPQHPDKATRLHIKL
jgi:hypothetical protein